MRGGAAVNLKPLHRLTGTDGARNVVHQILAGRPVLNSTLVNTVTHPRNLTVHIHSPLTSLSGPLTVLIQSVGLLLQLQQPLTGRRAELLLILGKITVAVLGAADQTLNKR